MGWMKGLEPSTYGTTIHRSNQLSYTHHIGNVQLAFPLMSYWYAKRESNPRPTA